MHLPLFAQEFDRLYAASELADLASPLEWVVMPAGEAHLPGAFAVSPTSWRFQPYTPATVLPTSATQNVWARFTLAATSQPQTWFLRVPRTMISRVSLHRADNQGGWSSQSAGAWIAPADWPLRTRSPSFEIKTTHLPQTFYLRFENAIPVTERPMMIAPADYIDGAFRVGTLVGSMMGMMGILAALCAAAAYLGRASLFMWLGAWVLSLLLVQLTLIGYASWRIWPHYAYLNQMMGWAAPLLAIATGSWFCAKASYARDSHMAIYRLFAFVSLGSLGMIAVVGLGTYWGVTLHKWMNAWLVFAIFSIIANLLWMMLRGQRWNGWLLLGCVPLGIASLSRLAYNYGLVRHIEITQLVNMILTQISMVWIFLALLLRIRASLLERALSSMVTSTHSTTGLGLSQIALLRMPKMMLRANRLSSGCGVLMVRWCDAASTVSLAQSSQREVLLAQVGRILRGAVRDVDTAVHLDDTNFLLMVEGPVSREALGQLASQLIAASLRATKDVTVQGGIHLNVAVWHGNALQNSTEEVMSLLRARLDQMTMDTHRRIQYVDAAAGLPPQADSLAGAQHKEQLLAKINAIQEMPSHTTMVKPENPQVK